MKKDMSGFTIVEVVIAVLTLTIAIAGVLGLLIYTATLSDMAANQTLAVNEAQSQLEQIRNYNFSDIIAAYSSGGTPGNIFTPASVTGKGTIYINSNGTFPFVGVSNSDLLGIKVVISFRNKYNHIVGEDINFNGQLDAGEDVDGNGQLSSPITVLSLIARR